MHLHLFFFFFFYIYSISFSLSLFFTHSVQKLSRSLFSLFFHKKLFHSYKNSEIWVSTGSVFSFDSQSHSLLSLYKEIWGGESGTDGKRRQFHIGEFLNLYIEISEYAVDGNVGVSLSPYMEVWVAQSGRGMDWNMGVCIYVFFSPYMEIEWFSVGVSLSPYLAQTES